MVYDISSEGKVLGETMVKESHIHQSAVGSGRYQIVLSKVCETTSKSLVGCMIFEHTYPRS